MVTSRKHTNYLNMTLSHLYNFQLINRWVYKGPAKTSDAPAGLQS